MCNIFKNDVRKTNVDFLFVCSTADLNVSNGTSCFSRFLAPAMHELREKGFSVECRLWPSLKCDIPKTYYRRLSILLRSETLSRYFLKYFKKPGALIVIGSKYSLCEAAKKLSIPIIETAHGFGLDKDDYIWGIGCRLNPTVDQIIAFDDQTYEVLNSNRISPGKAVRCAHPYISSIIHTAPAVPGVSQLMLDEKSRHVPKLKLGSSALVTLQHGYDGTIDAFSGIIPNGIIHYSLLEVIHESPDINWIIKLHPCQVTNRNLYKKTMHVLRSSLDSLENVSIVARPKYDIMELIASSDFHITMTSGTIIEAALIGVPSIGLCPSLRKEGVMQYAFSYAKHSRMLTLADLNKYSISAAIYRLLSMSTGESGRENFFSLEKNHPLTSDWLASRLTSHQGSFKGHPEI